MLIGIDASRVTIDQRTGTEGYSLHVVSSLLRAGQSAHKFRLYFRDEPSPALLAKFPNAEKVVINRRRIWTHWGLGPEVRANPVDVLFVPSHVIPWPGIGSIPGVVTIHDLGYLHYPEKHPLVQRLYLDWSTRHSANTAQRVIAVSQATAADLAALNNIPSAKIKVVHSGVDESMQTGCSPQEIKTVCKKYGIEGPYILHVGSVQPRKNLGRLVEAFAQLKDVVDGLMLVLAGRESWGYRSLKRRIQQLGLEDRVILTGYIPDDDLVLIYNGASVYAFPSLYEGFGFPALEAMACGTPVVCSNVSSLPEIVGDAALTVPPTDVNQLTNALRRLLTEPELHENLRQRGLARANQFTWEACGRETLQVLEEAAGVVAGRI